jgi:hypothetical protein
MQFSKVAIQETILMLICICLCIGLIYSDFVPTLIEIKDKIFYDK